jgi:hypothetical protein
MVFFLTRPFLMWKPYWQITFLVGQDRMDRSVQSAMKKIGWDTVKSQFPATVSESQALLEKTALLSSIKKTQGDSTHV